MSKVTLNDKKKVVIQRDYSKGTNIKFSTAYPIDVKQVIDEDSWTRFITQLNFLLEEAEAVNSRTIIETLLGCATCYLIRLCVKPYGYKHMDKVLSFIAETNESQFIPKGLYLTDPFEKGFRVLEVVMLYEPLVKKNDRVYQNVPSSSLAAR